MGERGGKAPVGLRELPVGALQLLQRPVENAQRKYAKRSENAETEQRAEDRDQCSLCKEGPQAGL